MSDWICFRCARDERADGCDPWPLGFYRDPPTSNAVCVECGHPPDHDAVLRALDRERNLLLTSGAGSTASAPGSGGAVVCETYSSEEAATIIGIDPKTLTKLRKSGALPAIRVGRVFRYSRAAVRSFLQGRVPPRGGSHGD